MNQAITLRSMPAMVVAALLSACGGSINEPVVVADGTKDASASKTVNGRIEVGDDVTVTSGAFRSVNGSARIGSRSVVPDVTLVNGSLTVGDDTRTGELATVNGGITLGERTVVSGEVSTVNGAIRIGPGSVVDESVNAINGKITLDGVTVEGDVENVNQGMDLTGATHIKGRLVVRERGNMDFPERAPVVTIGAGVRIDGGLVFRREVELRIHRGAEVGEITGAEPVWIDDEVVPEGS